ncbi:MAG: DUF488 domain-containing protein [Thermodesulfovibrionales bacterium]|nr:DUF488 domain-containing protein [Thermodesulfovibrionales bacterium]
MSQKIVYTLGTDRRSEEDFIEILNAHDIECVIDVRRFPTSKLSQFKRENFEDFLKADGFRYYFMGEGLGGYRKGGYPAYILTEEFLNALQDLLKVIETCPSVIVCSEKFPWKCHRRWIARELRRRGWKVIHIIEKDRLWIPD